MKLTWWWIKKFVLIILIVNSDGGSISDKQIYWWLWHQGTALFKRNQNRQRNNQPAAAGLIRKNCENVLSIQTYSLFLTLFFLLLLCSKLGWREPDTDHGIKYSVGRSFHPRLQRDRQVQFWWYQSIEVFDHILQEAQKNLQRRTVWVSSDHGGKQIWQRWPNGNKRRGLKTITRHWMCLISWNLSDGEYWRNFRDFPRLLQILEIISANSKIEEIKKWQCPCERIVLRENQW